ncbi:hypothetical protein J3459_008432 [Metarhizium acridum]|nr:hypothetical protein J3459_008432 [Metarhizium acridum]
MADALGLVASVITLDEVATKVIALKKLWEKVQDIEALNSVMEEVEAQAKRNAVLGVRTGVLSMRSCKQAATELDEAIRELQQRIEPKSQVRRTFAKIKVVLEQDSILRAQNRLQGALQMMQLALTLHAWFIRHDQYLHKTFYMNRS